MRALFKRWLDSEQRQAPDPEATWVSLNRRLGADAGRPPAWAMAALSAAVAAGVYAAWPRGEAGQVSAVPEVAVAPAPIEKKPERSPAVEAPPKVISLGTAPAASDSHVAAAEPFKAGDLEAVRAAIKDASTDDASNHVQLNEMREFVVLYQHLEAGPAAIGWSRWLDRRIAPGGSRFTDALRTAAMGWRFRQGAEELKSGDWVAAYQQVGRMCERLLVPQCPTPVNQLTGRAHDRYLEGYGAVNDAPTRARLAFEEVRWITPEKADLHLKAEGGIHELERRGVSPVHSLADAARVLRQRCGENSINRECEDLRALHKLMAHALNAVGMAAVVEDPEQALKVFAEVAKGTAEDDPENRLARNQIEQVRAVAPHELGTTPR
jgi:hypothetical protein